MDFKKVHCVVAVCLPHVYIHLFTHIHPHTLPPPTQTHPHTQACDGFCYLDPIFLVHENILPLLENKVNQSGNKFIFCFSLLVSFYSRDHSVAPFACFGISQGSRLGLGPPSSHQSGRVHAYGEGIPLRLDAVIWPFSPSQTRKGTLKTPQISRNLVNFTTFSIRETRQYAWKAFVHKYRVLTGKGESKVTGFTYVLVGDFSADGLRERDESQWWQKAVRQKERQPPVLWRPSVDPLMQ